MVYFSMLPIDPYRARVDNLTLDSAVVLLRNLGNFDLDDLVPPNKIHHFPVDIKRLLGGQTQVREVTCRLLFKGGPSQATIFKGTFNTFILDRMMLVACEKGLDFVDSILNYSEGFALAGTS